MPKKQQERRQTARIQILLIGEATYQTSDDGTCTAQVVARDVSEQGAYLIAKTRPEVGARVELDLRCDAGLKQMKISLKAVGTVTRVDVPPESPGGFAIEFQSFSDLE
ncbi:MAG: PilZ domain-containing protein [Acidobacteriota bacterium]